MGLVLFLVKSLLILVGVAMDTVAHRLRPNLSCEIMKDSLAAAAPARASGLRADAGCWSRILVEASHNLASGISAYV